MIREAAENDLFQINEIYNQAVLSQFETGDTQPVSMELRMDWFRQHSHEKYPVYVYDSNEHIAGWLSFSPYRFGRGAFQYTAEISFYMDANFKQQGIGTLLIGHAINVAKKLNIKTLIAIVLDENKVSLHLLKKFKFTEWGNLPGVANFHGKECGHIYLGLRL